MPMETSSYGCSRLGRDEKECQTLIDLKPPRSYSCLSSRSPGNPLSNPNNKGALPPEMCFATLLWMRLNSTNHIQYNT
ncbi:hypothetical protein SFRURICE_008471 [Spodoptera frugiperda]|nr:hypothetical protein SFRURICE_008471 [Spodoptera frugiperda]